MAGFKAHITEIRDSYFRCFLLLVHSACFIGVWVSFFKSNAYKKHVYSIGDEYDKVVHIIVVVVVYAFMVIMSYILLVFIAVVVWYIFDVISEKGLEKLTLVAKALGAVAFPVVSVLLGAYYTDPAGLWTCIFTSLVIYCQLVIVGVQDDLGCADAFIAIALSIAVHLDSCVIKVIGVACLGMFKHVFFPLLKWKCKK